MDKKLYPLDVGQMLQYLPIRETGTQRCCNISIFFRSADRDRFRSAEEMHTGRIQTLRVPSSPVHCPG